MSKGPVLIDIDGAPRRAAPEHETEHETGHETGHDTERETAPRAGAPAPEAARGGRLIDALPPAPNPADAPVVGGGDAPEGRAIRMLEVLARRRPSRLGAWALRLALALVAFLAGLAFWEFVTALLVSNPILGWTATALAGSLALVLLAICVREWAAFVRLDRLDRLQQEADRALAGTAEEARGVAGRVARLYADRPALSAEAKALPARAAEVMDADAVLALTERTVIAPLDAAALKEVEGAARQVALVTAFVPLALADILAAGTANLRMIRRIAEIYGGRSGTLGNWRLTRAVFTHLAATGAVAAGDDLVHSALGGNLLARLSRRFGEGLVNGALTARVGVAAMEVCRPLPFRAQKRPSVTGIVQRSLTGLFDRGGSAS